MIRAAAYLILVLTSLLVAVPSIPMSGTISHTNQLLSTIVNPDPVQLNGTEFAFNSTLAHFDLYTIRNATVSPSPSNGTLTWFSKFNRTLDGQPIPGTAFNYSIPKNPLGATAQNVTFTLNIPSGGRLQSSGYTYVKFDWNGTVRAGTGARYLVYNSTSAFNSTTLVRRVVETGNFTGSPVNATGIVTGPPVACGATDECFDVSKFIGYSLTLTFLFNSTTAGGGLNVQVSNVQVASVKIIQTQASAHWMVFDPANPSEIVHYGKMPLNFSSLVTYPRPHATNQFLNHTWAQMVLTLYWPSSYTLNNATIISGSRIFPTTSPAVPLSQGTCTPIEPTLECTHVVFLSLNMTAPNDTALNKIALLTATSTNAITSVKTGIGTSDTNFWTPGENITLRVTNKPGVDAKGPQAAWFTTPNGLPEQNSTLTLSAGAGTANYTISLPISQLGNWNVTAVFSNNYDYGRLSHQFRIDEIQVTPGSFSLSGSAGSGTSISANGALTYMSNLTAAANVNATVFAISNGPGTGITYTKGTASSGLYISNITLVNGIGTVGQPITMYFSLTNPSSNLFSANLTIDHEWYSGQTHGVNATIPLTLGDEPFIKPPIVYTLQAAFTSTGVQVTIQSLQTTNRVTVNMTPGTGASAVPFLRQHFGLFRLTIHAKTGQVGSTQSLESPTYAYILYRPLIPSQLLAYSSTVGTLPNGSFSASIPANQLLGVKNLFFIVLARDSNGVVLGDRGRSPGVTSDSTTLTPTADTPSDATVHQSVAVTLHLKSNSTTLAMTLTVNLDLTGTSASIPTQTHSVSLAPGGSQDVSFTFTTPSTPGLYLVTFSSPQYGSSGSPLLTKTLQVSLVSSNLQVLIPAAIGLVAAILILGVYTVRRGPTEKTGLSEKTKPAAKPSKPQASQSSSKSLSRS